MTRSVAILLIVSLCVTILGPLTIAQNTAYQRGYEDGKRAANRDIKITDSLIEAFWGFLLGPFPVLQSLTSKTKLPSHRKQKLENHSPSYKEGFRKGYKETLEQTTLLSRIGGWGGWIGFWALVFHP